MHHVHRHPAATCPMHRPNNTPTPPTPSIIYHYTAPHSQAVARFLAQLDEIFGTPADPHPASGSVAVTNIEDWSKDPWARGAYT